jgi:hypothetical protein
MVDLLGERAKKNQGVQHKNCQEPALQMTAKTSGAQLSQPLSCRFGFVQQARSAAANASIHNEGEAERLARSVPVDGNQIKSSEIKSLRR